MSVTSSPADWDLATAADALRRREVSSVELVHACLRKIEDWQPRINCFISLEADSALDAARRADTELARGDNRGPLHGVPLAFKDIFRRQGRTVTAGTRMVDEPPAGKTATVIERLEGAGGVLLGTLNLTEWIGYATGENPGFGNCRNPWDTARVPGGSSSGAAAAVAARLVYGAVASDTGGSGRTPAAFCNVVGIKPTYGLVSRNGAVPRAWSLDNIGVMARTAVDCALMLGVIAGHDERDPTTSRLPTPDYEAASRRIPEGSRIGVVDELLGTLPSAAAGVLDSAAAALSELGVKRVGIRLPDLGPFFALSDAVMKCEAAAIHNRRLRERRSEYSPVVLARIEAGLHLSAARYAEALAMRPKLTGSFIETAFAEVDALLLPAVTIPAPLFTEVESDDAGTVPQPVIEFTRYFRPFNYLGLPALIVPGGVSAEGMPLAFQLVGRPFGEARLLALARAFQSVTRWHQAEPQLKGDDRQNAK